MELGEVTMMPLIFEDAVMLIFDFALLKYYMINPKNRKLEHRLNMLVF